MRHVCVQVLVREVLPRIKPVPLRFFQVFERRVPGWLELLKLICTVSPPDFGPAEGNAPVYALARGNVKRGAMDRAIRVQIVRSLLWKDGPSLPFRHVVECQLQLRVSHFSLM